VVALIVLSGFGVNVTAALAGLGIGGLAIGLGAQKTFENLLGGISILIDKALVIGDPCRIGDQRGVVEDIGLRSTKLRTEDRTIVTIPNGTVATAVLENYRQRDKILFRQLVRLRYDLSSDHLRYLLDEARAVLKQNNRVENATSRVRLLRMAEYSIEVEIYAYILVRDYAEFLALQEELILSIVDAIEKTGAAIALPSVGPVFAQDAWIDPEKVKPPKPTLRNPAIPAHPTAIRPPLDPLQESTSVILSARNLSSIDPHSPLFLRTRTCCTQRSTRCQIPAETSAFAAPTTRA